MSEPMLNAPPIILIVEDEEPIAQALALIIEDYGHQPLIATNGRQALAVARSHQLALIITDLMMPRMTGAEFIAALREDGKQGYQLPPIVLMSAAGTYFTDLVEADAILAKPFDLAEVEALLARFLPAK